VSIHRGFFRSLLKKQELSSLPPVTVILRSLSRDTLRYKIKKYSLRRPSDPPESAD